MKIFIPWLSALLFITIFSSCRNDSVAPIRNVRFDPGLLNPIQAAGSTSCLIYNYSYASETKALGTVYGRMILISFNDGSPSDGAEAVKERFGFIEGLGQAVRTNSALLYPVHLVEGLNCKQVEAAIAEIAKDPAISYAAPFFDAGANGQLLGVSNEFIVQVEQDKRPGAEVVERLANATRTEIVTALDNDTFVLRADKHSRGNALEMANFFHEQPHIKHAEPDFVVSLAP